MVKAIVPILTLLCGTPVFAQTNWATFGFDHERTGYNPQESTLSVANVAGLTSKWSTDLGATITAQPSLQYRKTTAHTVPLRPDTQFSTGWRWSSRLKIQVLRAASDGRW